MNLGEQARQDPGEFLTGESDLVGFLILHSNPHNEGWEA